MTAKDDHVRVMSDRCRGGVGTSTAKQDGERDTVSRERDTTHHDIPAAQFEFPKRPLSPYEREQSL